MALASRSVVDRAADFRLSVVIHEEALRLFAEPGLEGNLDFERRHKAIIDRFGRFPHRNAVLGRTSTTDELEFLKQPGSSF